MCLGWSQRTSASPHVTDIYTRRCHIKPLQEIWTCQCLGGQWFVLIFNLRSKLAETVEVPNELIPLIFSINSSQVLHRWENNIRQQQSQKQTLYNTWIVLAHKYTHLLLSGATFLPWAAMWTQSQCPTESTEENRTISGSRTAASLWASRINNSALIQHSSVWPGLVKRASDSSSHSAQHLTKYTGNPDKYINK